MATMALGSALRASSIRSQLGALYIFEAMGKIGVEIALDHFLVGGKFGLGGRAGGCALGWQWRPARVDLMAGGVTLPAVVEGSAGDRVAGNSCFAAAESVGEERTKSTGAVQKLNLIPQTSRVLG